MLQCVIIWNSMTFQMFNINYIVVVVVVVVVVVLSI